MKTAAFDVRFGSALGPLPALDQLLSVEVFHHKKQFKLERFEVISGPAPKGDWRPAEGPFGPYGEVFDSYVFRLHISSDEPLIDESGWWDAPRVRWTWQSFGEIETLHHFNEDRKWGLGHGSPATEPLLKAAIALRRNSTDIAPFQALVAHRPGAPDTPDVRKVFDRFLEAAEREIPALRDAPWRARENQFEMYFDTDVFLYLPNIDHFQGVTCDTPGVVVKSASIADATWTPSGDTIAPLKQAHVSLGVNVQLETTEGASFPSHIKLIWSWKQAGVFIANHPVTRSVRQVEDWIEEPAGFDLLRRVRRRYEDEVYDIDVDRFADHRDVSEDFSSIDPFAPHLSPGMANIFARVRLDIDPIRRDDFEDLKQRLTDAGYATSYLGRALPATKPAQAQTRERSSILLPAPEGATLTAVSVSGVDGIRIDGVELGPSLDAVRCWDHVDEMLRATIEAKGPEPMLHVAVEGPVSMAAQPGAIDLQWSGHESFRIGIDAWVDEDNDHSTNYAAIRKSDLDAYTARIRREPPQARSEPQANVPDERSDWDRLADERTAREAAETERSQKAAGDRKAILKFIAIVFALLYVAVVVLFYS